MTHKQVKTRVSELKGLFPIFKLEGNIFLLSTSSQSSRWPYLTVSSCDLREEAQEPDKEIYSFCLEFHSKHLVRKT